MKFSDASLWGREKAGKGGLCLFLSRCVRTGFLICLSIAMLTGCSIGDSTDSSGVGTPAVPGNTPASPPSKQATVNQSVWRTAEIPYAYASMQDDVVIQLTEEPRLLSPIQTIVGTEPQAYTFFFRQPMDRSSVEQAIRDNAQAEAKREDLGYVEPLLTFHWVHDQQLHLLAELPEQKTAANEWKAYRLHIAGAKTAKGDPLTEESPDFRALVMLPDQVWKVSLDGKEQEKITDWKVRYSTTILDEDARYFLMSRFARYCECDARYPKLYWLYDNQTKQLISYPGELLDHYQGEGEFVADRRGFFFASPPAGTEVPPSETAATVKVDGYVYGASFSKDRQRLLMAIGTAEQRKDLDFVVYDLEAGKIELRLPGVMQGVVASSEVDDSLVTVRFADDGQQVTFAMREHEGSYLEKRYRLDWKTGTVSDWNPPVPADSWAGYAASDDGMYQMYLTAGLFKGSEAVADYLGQGYWLPGSHQYVYVKWESTNDRQDSFLSLHLFDADRKQHRVLRTGLPSTFDLLGVSRDGNWLYVSSDRDLAVNR